MWNGKKMGYVVTQKGVRNEAKTEKGMKFGNEITTGSKMAMWVLSL